LRDSMKRKRFTEEQIVSILRGAQTSAQTVSEVCRKQGISEPTFYAWRRKYESMSEPEVRRLRELEKENGRLKRLVAERDLEIDAMKELVSKKL
jgi:putative transposase